MSEQAEQSEAPVLHLFEGVGIELEYMLVNMVSLDVQTDVDQLIAAKTGNFGDGDYEAGAIAWSNELTAHVVEFKTNGPAESLVGLAQAFQAQVRDANAVARTLISKLMPGGMHPWMNPMREMKLWPHEFNEVYSAYNKIYDCRGQGWANLQSMHINLPFNGSDEFGRLHAAIRLVLPIISAISASSPVMEGKLTGISDSRLEVYRTNSTRVPLATAQVIPEQVFSPEEYQSEILAPLYAQLAPHDPSGILQHEYANSRGAIARFDRDAIEIRVIDIAECPAADMAIASLVIGAVRALVEERHASYEQQKTWQVAPLAQLFIDCVKSGGETVIRDADYLALFGIDATSIRALDLWREISDRAEPVENDVEEIRETILAEGSLSHRLTQALGTSASREELHSVWSQLAQALAEGKLFNANSTA